jgi:hypothetical protein
VTSEHVPNGGTNGANGVAMSPEWERMQRLALVAGLVGIGIVVVFGLTQTAVGDNGVRQFFVSYLAGWTFWLALPVGCMGFVGITHITGASWGVLLMRFFEAATRTLPLMFVLFIPVAISVGFSNSSPYPWSQPPESFSKIAEEVEEIKFKFENFRNAPFFLARMAFYFAMWGLFIFLLNRWGRQVEQTNDPKPRRLLENLSGPMVVFFALGNMFAVTDIVMGLDMNFASTMFPLIYSINQLLICLCFSVAVFLTLSTQSPMKDVLRPKFQIDMGSFMLGLTMIWSYMNFAQFMLIWIGNLPDEIPYYLKRINGGWEYVADFQCIFHFALPFVLLLMRDVKLHRKRLRAMAIFILSVCALDVVWWIEPAYPHDGLPLYLIMDIGAFVGIGGLWGWYFLYQLKKYPLLPTNYIGQLPKGHHAH